MKTIVKGLSALALVLVMFATLAVPGLAWTNVPDVAVVVNDLLLVMPGQTDIQVERGEELEIELAIHSIEALEDVEITAKLSVEYGDETTMDSTGLFDLVANKTRKKTLSLTIPKDLEFGDATLFIIVQDKVNIDGEQYKFGLHISGERHDLGLERVVLTPADVVKAGSFLTVKARVENFGKRTEDDILLTAEVVGLAGASDSVMIDEIENEDDGKNSETADELYVGIPLCAEAGEYKVKVALSYNGDRDEEVKYFPVTVLESGSKLCNVQEPNLAVASVTVPSATQVVKQGESLVVPVTISNSGSEAKNYFVTLTVGDWGAVRFVPSNVVTVGAGSTETVYAYVDTAADASGEKVLGLEVKAGNEVVKETTLKASIEGDEEVSSSSITLRKVLEIGLVVLIVLIVLVGLIIGFNKLRDDDEEFDEDDKSYY